MRLQMSLVDERIEAALVARLKDKDFIVRTKAAETLQKMNIFLNSAGPRVIKSDT